MENIQMLDEAEIERYSVNIRQKLITGVNPFSENLNPFIERGFDVVIEMEPMDRRMISVMTQTGILY